MVLCAHCGASLPDEAAFCGTCGSRLARSELARSELAEDLGGGTLQMPTALPEAPALSPSETEPGDPRATRVLPVVPVDASRTRRSSEARSPRGGAPAGAATVLLPIAGAAPTRMMPAASSTRMMPAAGLTSTFPVVPRGRAGLRLALAALGVAVFVAGFLIVLRLRAVEAPVLVKKPKPFTPTTFDPALFDELDDTPSAPGDPPRRSRRRPASVAPLPDTKSPPAPVAASPPATPSPPATRPSLPIAPSPPPAPPAEAKVGSAEDGVKAVVKAHQAEVAACYYGVSPLPPGGTIEINFLIGSHGKAAFVHVLSDAIGSRQVSGCLMELLKKWTFPFATSGDLGVTHPFVFAPRGS